MIQPWIMAAAKGWSGGGEVKKHLRQNQLLWRLIGKEEWRQRRNLWWSLSFGWIAVVGSFTKQSNTAKGAELGWSVAWWYSPASPAQNGHRKGGQGHSREGDDLDTGTQVPLVISVHTFSELRLVAMVREISSFAWKVCCSGKYSGRALRSHLQNQHQHRLYHQSLHYYGQPYHLHMYYQYLL